MRAPLFMMTVGAALLRGGCADMRALDKSVTGGFHPPANGDHPRAEAVLARGNQPAPVRESGREPGRESGRESMRDSMRESTRDSGRDGAATLREGIRLYNNGDFTTAIAKLNAPEIQNAGPATRTNALKYTAFSYCVTQRPVQCRQAFDKALRIDAGFALAPGEEGHPMWSPVFEKARANRHVTGAD